MVDMYRNQFEGELTEERMKKYKAELTADLVGDYLFTDEDFVRNLSAEKPNLFKKIYEEIKYLCKKATTGSAEEKKLLEVKRIFENTFRSDESTTGIEFSKEMSDYPYNIKTVIKEYIGATSPDMLDFIKDAKQETDKKRLEWMHRDFENVLADNIVKDISDISGVDISDFKIRINGESIHHIYRRHGENGQHDNSMKDENDLARLEYILRNVDTAERTINSSGKYAFDNQYRNSDNTPSPVITISKKINGTYYVALAVPDSAKKTLHIKSAFISKTKKIETEQEFDAKAPNDTSKTNLVTVSKLSISDISEKSSDNKVYSLSEDSNGNKLSPAVQKRFANSKAVDENGYLKVLYHGTASGEFSIFDKSKGSVEGDFGSGFYFTDNEVDVGSNYEGGGADFENKVSRRAEQIEYEEDIDYEEAKKQAREELYKGDHRFEVYLNIENPAIVGKTILLDEESLDPGYDPDDFDSEEEYYEEVENSVGESINELVWEVGQNVDVDTEGIASVLYEAYYEGGIQIEDLKSRINDLYLEDSDGNLVGNEVVRQIIESLGYDGIIDNTVSKKFKGMFLDGSTTHYIVFKPNQIKAITNETPTDNPDIHLSLGEQTAPQGYNVYGKDIALESALTPTDQIRETTKKVDHTGEVDEKVDAPTISQESINERSEELHAKLKKKKGVYLDKGEIEGWHYYVFNSENTGKVVVDWWNDNNERYNASHELGTSVEDALYSVTDFIAKPCYNVYGYYLTDDDRNRTCVKCDSG